MNKTRLYLYLIVGGYLAYTGFDLAANAFQNKLENYLLFLAVGILFLIIGAALAIRSLRRIVRGEYEDPLQDPQEDSEEDQAEDSSDSTKES